MKWNWVLAIVEFIDKLWTEIFKKKNHSIFHRSNSQRNRIDHSFKIHLFIGCLFNVRATCYRKKSRRKKKRLCIQLRHPIEPIEANTTRVNTTFLHTKIEINERRKISRKNKNNFQHQTRDKSEFVQCKKKKKLEIWFKLFLSPTKFIRCVHCQWCAMLSKW